MKNNIKKIFCWGFIIITILSTISGCSLPGKKGRDSINKDINMTDILEEIKSKADLSPMEESDAERLKRFFNIDEGSVEEFIYYAPASNITVSELLMIKAKKDEDLSTIKDNITKRIESQSESFKDYLPDEYYLIEKNVLDIKGKYVLFVISEDAKKVEDIFNAAFK